MNGVISMHDSLSSATISDGLGEQMARVYGQLETSVEDNGLTIHHVQVQKQEGGADCGLFAIAFAYHAAVGDHLDKMTFDQSKLRSHLVACLEKEQFSKFPTLPHRGKRACKRRISIVPLNCNCRLPDTFDNVVGCDNCQKWYHYKCVGFSSSAYSANWFCKDCT